MIDFLDNGGNLYIESVDIGANHNGTTFFDYLGLVYIGDGAEQEVVTINGDTNCCTSGMTFYYLGGYSPHYSLDRIDSANDSELLFSSEEGYGRMFLNDNSVYKAISSSVLMAAIASGDSLNIKPYLISEMVNYFLGYNPTTSLKENIVNLLSGVNYPNPFTTETKIEYTLKEAGRVRINVYNINGQIVKQLVNDELFPGDYSVIWDATNNSGVKVESGYYFYKINFGNFTKTEKMLFLR